MYAAIDVEAKLILHVAVFKRHGTDPVAAFLHEVTEKRLFKRCVSRRCLQLLDCLLSIRTDRSGQLFEAKPDRKVVSGVEDVGQPVLQLVGGQSAERPPVACNVRSLL